MLTEAQQAVRADRVTASFAPALLAGDKARIMREWMRLVGSPDYEPEDLSDSWPVQLGSFLEPLVIDWHQRKTGRELCRRGESVIHPVHQFVSATLDCYRADDSTVIDVKCIGAWRKLDDACMHYVPQMVVQRACVGAERAALLVCHGGAEPVEREVTWDADYEAAVWERIAWFWRAVEELRCPVAIEPIAAPMPAVREVCMDTSNAWCVAAAQWLDSRAAARVFASAEKELKSAIAPDVKRAFGSGVVATRDRANRIMIKEEVA